MDRALTDVPLVILTAYSIGIGDVNLVLDGACRDNLPDNAVVRFYKGSWNSDQVGAIARAFPRELGKFNLEADSNRNLDATEIYQDLFRTSQKCGLLPRTIERPFPVICQDQTVGSEQQCSIVDAVFLNLIVSD